MNTNVTTNTAIDTDTDESERSRIVWTEDERELLKLKLVEIFTKQELKHGDWLVTYRNLQVAQIDILSDDRYRAHLRNTDLSDMQARLDAHIRAVSADGILQAHYAYVAKHNKTPIDHVQELLGENDTLTVKLETSAARVEELEREVENLRSNVRDLTTVKAATRAPKAQAAPQEPASSKAKLRVAICAPHLNTMQKANVEAMVDVVWIMPNHSGKDVSRLASNLPTLVITGSCNTTVIKAIKATASDYDTNLNGYSSLITRLQSMTAEATV